MRLHHCRSCVRVRTFPWFPRPDVVVAVVSSRGWHGCDSQGGARQIDMRVLMELAAAAGEGAERKKKKKELRD